MHVLVVGGTGLIGSAITRQLLARGDQITLFTRGRTPARFAHGDSPGPAGAAGAAGAHDAAGSPGDVQPGPGLQRLRWLHGDRRDALAFEAAVRVAAEEDAFDAAIDLIGCAEEDAHSIVRALGGLCPQLVFCSSVAVYAAPAACYPIHEDEPLRPAGAYARGKATCEDILLTAHARGDLPVTILRPAQTYGEGAVPAHVFGRRGGVLHRLRSGQPVLLPGDGTALRVACYVDDVAAAFVGALGSARTLGRAYNVAGDEWLTWNDYTALLATAAGGPSPTVVYVPTDVLARAAPAWARPLIERDQYNAIYDNAAAKADLGFHYRTHAADGLRRTVAWLDRRGLIQPAPAEEAALYERLLLEGQSPHPATLAGRSHTAG